MRSKLPFTIFLFPGGQQGHQDQDKIYRVIEKNLAQELFAKTGRVQAGQLQA